MSNELFEKLKKYMEEKEDEKNEGLKKIDGFSSSLPTIILFLKVGGKQNINVICDYFQGTKAYLIQQGDNAPSNVDFVDSIIFVNSETNRDEEFGDVIVVENVKEVGKGNMMAKLTGAFADIFLIQDSSQILMFANLAQLYDELPDVRIFASQLHDKLWECYDIAREEFIKNGFTPNEMSDLISAIDPFRDFQNSFVTKVEALVTRVKI